MEPWAAVKWERTQPPKDQGQSTESSRKLADKFGLLWLQREMVAIGDGVRMWQVRDSRNGHDSIVNLSLGQIRG